MRGEVVVVVLAVSDYSMDSALVQHYVAEFAVVVVVVVLLGSRRALHRVH